MKIHRREFIGKLGTASAALMASHPLFAQPAKSQDRKSVLVETAHFKQTGGWVLDTQFANTLGFSYLLAHGMGKPVEDAVGLVQFPAAGKYHVWVLTRDWCPGDWDAPGQFRVQVNGQALGETFGTRPGWAWQSGGTVEVKANDTNGQVALKDLTGFEGRCSAVYFSLDPRDVPPSDLAVLPEWRRKKVGLSLEATTEHRVDVVIVGGGISGCAAALAAESQGLKVGLIHNRPVLGGNASAEIRVHTIGISAKAEEIMKLIDTPHYPNGSPEAIQADEKRMKNVAAAKGIETFLKHTVVDAEMRGKTIVSVTAIEADTGELKRFVSDQFIDCSGDGWLGLFAGAEFRYGRESKTEFGEGWDKHGDLWSPATPDKRVMGTSVLWYTKKAERRVDFPDVPWAAPVAKKHVSPAGEWYWEYSDNDKDQITDAEEIRDHMFRAIYGTYSNTIKQPKDANLELDWVGFNGGKRESRRLVGDHIYSGADSRDSVEFSDAVVTEKRDIDLHYQEKLKGRAEDFLSKALFQKPQNKIYYIPFRSLYSRDIENLMMAGRCFSCSHVGLGGPRVMKTCGQMGVATGFAAVLCKKHKANPREVGRKHIKELRALCGYSQPLGS